MAIRISIMITAIAMLLFFQNCAKAPMAADGAVNNSEKVIVTAGIKLDSKTFFIPHDASQGADEETVLNSGLKLDVQTGVLEYLGQRSTADGQIRAGDKFCLSDSERAQLSALVNDDSICKGLAPLEAGSLCAMAIRAPYAFYGSNSQSLSEVGFASCRKAPDVDFCGGQGAKIEALIKSVQASLSSHACK